MAYKTKTTGLGFETLELVHRKRPVLVPTPVLDLN